MDLCTTSDNQHMYLLVVVMLVWMTRWLERPNRCRDGSKCQKLPINPPPSIKAVPFKVIDYVPSSHFQFLATTQIDFLHDDLSPTRSFSSLNHLIVYCMIKFCIWLGDIYSNLVCTLSTRSCKHQMLLLCCSCSPSLKSVGEETSNSNESRDQTDLLSWDSKTWDSIQCKSHLTSFHVMFCIQKQFHVLCIFGN